MEKNLSFEQVNEMLTANKNNVQLSKHTIEELETQIEVMREIEKFVPVYSTFNMEFDNRDGSTYAGLRRVKHFVNKKWGIFIAKYNHDTEHHVLSNRSFGKYLSHYQLSEIRKELPQLNKMHKLSSKKIQAKIENEIEFLKRAAQKEDEQILKIEEFLTRVNGYPVDWRSENMGVIEMGPLRFTFSIEPGYIRQEIALNRYSKFAKDDLELFQKLARFADE